MNIIYRPPHKWGGYTKTVDKTLENWGSKGPGYGPVAFSIDAVATRTTIIVERVKTY